MFGDLWKKGLDDVGRIQENREQFLDVYLAVMFSNCRVDDTQRIVIIRITIFLGQFVPKGTSMDYNRRKILRRPDQDIFLAIKGKLSFRVKT